MDRKCPQCGSVDTGPSFTFDYDRDDSGRVVAQAFGPDDDEAINGFVDAINKEVVDAG